MADVRALLKEQQASRRIQHPHVTYSTTGRLICLVCNLQLKSESLWPGHQRSPNHKRLLQEAEGNKGGAKKVPSDGSASSEKTITPDDITNQPTLKRKSEGEDEDAAPMSPTKKRKERDPEDTPDKNEAIRKRSKSHIVPTQSKPKYAPSLPGFLPEGFFDAGNSPQVPVSKIGKKEEGEKEGQPPKTPAPKKDNVTPPMLTGEFTLASRPLTPMDTSRSASRSGSKPLTPMDASTPSKIPLTGSSTLQTITSAEKVGDDKKEENKTQAQIDEDEWAAFEADIAAAETVPDDAVITAAPVIAEEMASMTVEETYLSKRERLEREREQEREDIINKALDEQEEMRELEARVNRLKARTEEVKKLREQAKEKALPEVATQETKENEEEDDDDDSDLDEDDEDWLRG